MDSHRIERIERLDHTDRPTPPPSAAFPPDRPAPADSRDLVARLHAGELFVFAASPASRALVESARRLVSDALTGAPDADWDAVVRVRDPYTKLADVRRALSADPALRRHMAGVLAALGLGPDTEVDAPRLRTITAGAERDPGAAPVYIPHRDTWYGCPQELLVAWLPLQRTPSAQAFAFYPRWFARAVHNTSDAHDHTRWMATIGWHGDAPLSAYAAPTRPFDAQRMVRFDFEAGDVLLFSAAQLHQTLPNPVAGHTRYSVDFRVLPREGTDTAAPNVDNASVGADARLSAEFRPCRDYAVA